MACLGATLSNWFHAVFVVFMILGPLFMAIALITNGRFLYLVISWGCCCLFVVMLNPLFGGRCPLTVMENALMSICDSSKVSDEPFVVRTVREMFGWSVSGSAVTVGIYFLTAIGLGFLFAMKFSKKLRTEGGF